MIEGYIGRPGTGKTYTMTARILKQAAKYEAVVANYNIDIPNIVRIDDPAQLLDIKVPPKGGKILVALDEAHLWLPSRLSMKLPPSLLMKFSQTRKAGWDLLWTAQHEARVDKVLKDVTNWMWLCESWFGWLSPWPEGKLFFTAKCYEPEVFRKKDKHTCRAIRRYRKKIGEAYDTKESLAVASHVSEVKDHYKEKAVSGAQKSSSAGGSFSGRGAQRLRT
jgi:hypothetical protein